jgi:capsular polysaccharide transport system ATP-binding protein
VSDFHPDNYINANNPAEGASAGREASDEVQGRAQHASGASLIDEDARAVDRFAASAPVGPLQNLRLHNVSKSYQTKAGTQRVLDNMSIDFPRGRNIAILGRNGAGKSTLMRLIAGVESPSSGHVERLTRISWPIGFGGGVHAKLSGYENCRFIARIYNTDPDEMTDFVADFSDLGDYFYMPVRTYSSGMRAKLAFGMSMAIQFDCYLIDELTAVGDEKFRKKCKEVFDTRLAGADVIVVSHQPNTMKDYCDMAAVLHDGHIRFYDDLAEAIEIYKEL